MPLYDRKYYDKGLFTIDKFLWYQLRKIHPETVFKHTGIRFIRNGYNVPFMGQDYIVDPMKEMICLHNNKISVDTAFQLYLVLVTYLSMVENAQLTGKLISEKQLPGGITFFQGVHALDTDPLRRIFEKKPETFKKLGTYFRWTAQKFGDMSYKIEVLPKIQICLIFFEADEEFPASLKMLFDQGIMAVFSKLDCVWALVNLTVECLLSRLEIID